MTPPPPAKSATARAGKSPAPDAVCAGAVDIARAAAVAVGGDDVGEHLGCEPSGDRTLGTVVDHFFACTHPGYRGWRWVATVARAPRGRAATVDEVALLPGSDALAPPPWLPWSERVRPGDLGPGDLLPTAPDDRRLVPAYTDVHGEQERAVADELGLGRVRVLSREGRDAAAERWLAGEGGPAAPIARQAPGSCGTCGFYYPLTGALGGGFGACSNAFAADDGRVVSADHGCGAHSEAVQASALPQNDADPPLIDDYRYEYEVTPSGPE